MMKYEGYEELVLNCSELFDELEEEFIKKAKEVLKTRDFYVDNEQLEIAFSRCFRGLIGINEEASELLALIKSCFSGDELLAKYVIKSCVEDFKSKFCAKISGAKLEKYKAFLDAAIVRFDSVFELKENFELPKIEDESEQKTNTISFGDEGIVLFGDIFDELKKAQELKQNLKLLNLYKGVNIKCDAEILDIKEQKLYLKLDLMQILAMREEGNAFILKNAAISSDIMAKISNFDFASSSVILKDFVRSTKTAAVLRRYARVHPRITTPVILRSNDGTSLQAKLFDISEGGLGAVSEQSRFWDKREPLNASFELEINGQMKQISVNVELVVALNYQGSMRYCCQIVDTNQDSMPDIIAFSRSRVSETIDELRKKAQSFI